MYNPIQASGVCTREGPVTPAPGVIGARSVPRTPAPGVIHAKSVQHTPAPGAQVPSTPAPGVIHARSVPPTPAPGAQVPPAPASGVRVPCTPAPGVVGAFVERGVCQLRQLRWRSGRGTALDCDARGRPVLRNRRDGAGVMRRVDDSHFRGRRHERLLRIRFGPRLVPSRQSVDPRFPTARGSLHRESERRSLET